MNVLYLNLCKWLRNTNTHKEIIACCARIIRTLLHTYGERVRERERFVQMKILYRE